MRLELAAEWLVMAAWLAWLKSRLLLPEPEAGEEDPELLAEALAGRLRALERARAGAAWLAARPLLGREVHARGAPESLTREDRSRLAADLPGLARAFLSVTRRAAARRPWRPPPRRLWTVREAMDRLAALLGGGPGWTELSRFLPGGDGEEDPAARRAALASTLVAGLEMARQGRAEFRQEAAFAPLWLRALPPGAGQDAAEAREVSARDADPA